MKMLAGAQCSSPWAGIVLLAIDLPEHLRVPVLSAVVAACVIGAVIAHMLAKRKASSARLFVTLVHGQPAPGS